MLGLEREILIRCREGIREISEFHNLFQAFLSSFDEGISEGIIPFENIEGNLAFLYSYVNNIEQVSGLISNYIDEIESFEQSSKDTSLAILFLSDKQMLQSLEQRSCICGTDFKELENVLIECKKMGTYWYEKEGLDSKIFYNLEYDIQRLKEKYKTIALLLEDLNKCIEEHISELKGIVTPMAFVYASPEVMIRESVLVDERPYPDMHSVTTDDNTTELKGLKEVIPMAPVYASPEVMTRESVLVDERPYPDIHSVTADDNTESFTQYRSDTDDEKSKKEGFFKRLFKRR